MGAAEVIIGAIFDETIRNYPDFHCRFPSSTNVVCSKYFESAIVRIQKSKCCSFATGKKVSVVCELEFECLEDPW